MTPYQASYEIRYKIPSLQQQIEVAGVKCCEDIKNEDPATPEHENRVGWANWYSKNSQIGWVSFAWPTSMNPTIQAAIQADPTGATVTDSDVQFVVNSALPNVVADWAKSVYYVPSPPSGESAAAIYSPPPKSQ
jgi:hypothetical protein